MLPHQVDHYAPPPTIDVAQAEAALTEHYPRLARLAYLVLPASLPHHRRVRTAHALTQRALPYIRVQDESPAARAARTARPVLGPLPTGAEAHPRIGSGYPHVRVRVVRGALEASVPRTRWAWPNRGQLPPLLPLVWGLRLTPRSGRAEELALDQRLSVLPPPARAACVLRVLERLSAAETRGVLAAVGVTDPDTALAAATRLLECAPDEAGAPGAPGRAGTSDAPGVRGASADTARGAGAVLPAPREGAQAERSGTGEPRTPPAGPDAHAGTASEAGPSSEADAGAGAGAAAPSPPPGERTAPRPGGDQNTTPRTTPAEHAASAQPSDDSAAPHPVPGEHAAPHPAPAGDDDARPPGPEERAAALLNSPAFDPCFLQARPSDLLRRRQWVKASAVACGAALVCGALLGLPERDTGSPEPPAAAPAGPAAGRILDPGALTRIDAGEWRTSARRDYSVWPARGGLMGDRALLRRALTTWAHPGAHVRVSATPGTSTGTPPGPAQLLYAGELDHTRVVLLYDGLRVARYAEPAPRTHGPRPPGADAAATGPDRTVLDLARVDGAVESEAGALVVDRADGGVRYLTAPWVRATAVRDLLKPQAEPAALDRSPDGVTAALPAPSRSGDCRSWPALQVRDTAATRLLTDLGEPVPAHLTAGRPTAPGEAASGAALTALSRTACSFVVLRAHGVRSVNSWRYTGQRLPESDGTADWLCTRAETWRGPGSRTLAQFRAPGGATAVVADARDTPDCGKREARVLAGALWKSPAGHWFLLAAGSEDVVSIEAGGAVRAAVHGRLLAVPARRGERPELAGRLADGTRIAPPG